MKVLLTGAGGFLGSAILERLLAEGHQVIACARNRDNLPNHPKVTFQAADLDTMLAPDDWVPLLENVQAVINCAGILREHRHGEFERIHHQAPLALAQACHQKNIGPFVQVSVLGEPEDGEFIASKHRLDQALLEMDLPAWVLRPSVVLSLRGSYGGTSALRAAAALPGLIVLPGKGDQQIQPLLLEDLARLCAQAINRLAGHDRPMEMAGPEVLTVHETLAGLRAWMKLPPARWVIRMPERLVSILAQASDWLHAHPMGLTTWKMLQRGNVAVADAGKPVAEALDVSLQDVRAKLQFSASYVQDRWHARLQLLAPLAWLALVAIWLVSGIIGLLATPEQYQPILAGIGIPEPMQETLTLATGTLNLVLGVLLLIRWQMHAVLWLMLVSVLAYTLVLGVGSPALWLDLAGGLIKNAAIMVLIGFCLVTRKAR